MMDSTYELLLASLSVAATLCAMAMFPFVLYALLSSRVPLLGKVSAVGVYGALALLSSTDGTDPVVLVVSHVVAFGYATLCAIGVWLAGRKLEHWTAVGSACLFLALCGVLLIVPGTLLPPPASFVAVAWCFELLFKSYSYLRDGRLEQRRPELERALFFLLIDPVLCFQERGRRKSDVALTSHGASRCALGALALLGHGLLVSLLFTPLGSAPPAALALTDPRLAALFVVHYTGRFLAGYGRHSGGASVAIGAMRLLGYAVPERYHYPWLATSPADFWRRWNMYLGSWARRYVFVPLAGRLQRELRHLRGRMPLAKSAAVLVTFSLIGVLHDLGVYAQHGRWPLGGLLVFGLNGIALLAWVAVGRGVDAALGATREYTRSRTGYLAPLLSRMFFLPFLVGTVWIAIPTMSTDFALSVDVLWRALVAGGSQ